MAGLPRLGFPAWIKDVIVNIMNVKTKLNDLYFQKKIVKFCQ